MKRIIPALFFSFLFISCVLNAQTTVTFNFTGAEQTWTVPAGITTLSIDAQGASGGGTMPRANGGRVQADIPVTPGETLYIYVGAAGGTETGGFNGGGNGIGTGGGGGGASDIRSGGNTLNDRIVVAGGAGGSTSNGGHSLGGLGGGLTGGTANIGTNPWLCSAFVPATGGSQVSGGTGGQTGSCAWNGSDGTFGQGGNSFTQFTSAGGGGGWYGGGGAGNGQSGAGGSSYTFPSATNVIHTQGFRTGDGMIEITYDAVASIPTLSQWGLITLSLVMFIFGLVAIRQRRLIFG